MAIENTSYFQDPLPDNRNGGLAPLQKSKARTALYAQIGQCLGLLFLGSFFFIGILAGIGSSASPMDPTVAAALFVLSLPFILGAIWPGVKAVQLAADLRSGRVEQASGEITWRRGRYRAQTAERQLDLGGIELEAGTQMFYYLPRSGRVVSAETLMPDTPEHVRQLLLRALAESNHFKIGFLDDFRQGRLGRGRLHQLERTWTAPAWILLFALAILIAFAILASQSPADSVLTPLCLVDILAGLVLVGYLAAGIVPTVDVLKGRLILQEGIVRKERVVTGSGRSQSVRYYYLMDSQRWKISNAAYNALIEGKRYRIYSLPRSKRLVAVEPLEPDATSS